MADTLTYAALRKAVAHAVAKHEGWKNDDWNYCADMPVPCGDDCVCAGMADAALAAIVRATEVDAHDLNGGHQTLVARALNLPSGTHRSGRFRCAALLRALAEAGEART